MRLFTSFGLLGLLHIARGGGLDEHAESRARNIRQGHPTHGLARAPPDEAAPAPVASIANLTVTERQQFSRSIHEQLDSNGDGHIDRDELINSFYFYIGDSNKVHSVLAALGLPSVDELIGLHDTNGDARLSLREVPAIHALTDDSRSNKCAAVKNKIESCRTEAVIRCSPYLSFAESACHLGHKNIVEMCIMSESCDNICKCISHAEEAAAGNAVFQVVDQFNVAHSIDPFSMTEVGQHRKRWFWVVLLILLPHLLPVAIAELTLAYAHNVEESRWMNTKVWDDGGSPPDCSVYIYWGTCGATIWDKKRKECPGGGKMVHGRSCDDHFRAGSRGCGTLNAGCQSLCTNVNPKGCPCSYFDWVQIDDIDYPGNDIGYKTVNLLSECRKLCADDAKCVAFVIPPLNGQQNQRNCYLKSKLGAQTRSDGVTTFVKKSKGNEQCSENDLVKGSYDADWWSASPARRDLIPRGIDDAPPFRYNIRNPAERNINEMMNQIYQRYMEEDSTWLDAAGRFRTRIGESEARAGRGQGRPNDAVYLSYRPLPRWRPSEIGYRVLSFWRTLAYQAVTNPNVADPVTAYFNQHVPTTGPPSLTQQFSPTVRALLLANSASVHRNRGERDTWIARSLFLDRESPPSTHPPYAGVNVGYDRRITAFQRGNAGPMSLEAAFLLALQVGGVNMQAVGNILRRATNAAPWWIGILTPGNDRMECLNDQRDNRVIGQFQRHTEPQGSTQHDSRAGVYIMLDLDPDLPEDDPNHNVFVFIVHTLDSYSTLQVPNPAHLQQTVMRTYEPSSDESSATYWTAQGSTSNAPARPATPPPGGTNPQANTRIMAHAHAGILPRTVAMEWVHQNRPGHEGPLPMPRYTQISFIHNYILTEDVELTDGDTPADWPRSFWLRDNDRQ